MTSLVAVLEISTDKAFFGELLSRIVSNLALRFVSDNPQVREATIELSDSLGKALRADYIMVGSVFICCIALLLVFIVSPLLYKWISKPRLEIFISFNRTKEGISENLQKYLEKEGTRVFRIPFQEGATHQSIVMQATEGIRKCDGFVCLPGYAQSYVEHEVLAASASAKPIVFLISENSGTLPNTADKRYPMFRLETTLQKGFKPLADFIGYVGADLASTWKLCKRALRHPLMNVSLAVTAALEGICLVALWVYFFFIVTVSGHGLTKQAPAFTEVEGPVVLAHLAVLVLLGSISFICFSYVSLFLINLTRQFRARKKAMLKTVAARFERDDWIGVIPDLFPGGNMYECLFETAPSAHHEIENGRNAF